jgi:hypothetical protein
MYLAPTFAPAPSMAVLPGASQAIGHVITAGLPVVAGVAAAAGAVFLTRAALQGLGVAAEINERDRASVAHERDEAIAWDRSFAEVSTRNARIVRLTQLAAAHSAQLPPGWTLPEQFSYRGQTREAVAQWCRAADDALARAEPDVARLRIQVALAQLRVSEKEAAVRRRIADGLLRAAAPTGTPRPVPRPTPPPQHLGIDLRPLVDDALEKAAAEVSAEDFALLTEQAATVLDPTGPRDPRTDLDQLYRMVADARRRQDRRAEDAALAARWLVALAPLEGQTQPTDFQRGVLDALREVAAERRELDPTLRSKAEGLAGAAARAAEDRAISEIVAQELAMLGYDVELEQAGSTSTVQLSVSRTEWGATHRASIEIGEGGLEAWYGKPDPQAGRTDLHLKRWAQDVRHVYATANQKGLRTGELVVDGDPETPVETAESGRRRPHTAPEMKARDTPSDR